MALLHKGAIPIKNIDLAQPATFLFDSKGKVIWSYISTNYRIRPKTMDIFVAAKKHFKKWLLSGFEVLSNKEPNKRREQGFTSFSNVMYELKEAKIERKVFL